MPDPYTPDPVGNLSSPAEIAAYVQRELQRLSVTLSTIQGSQMPTFTELHVEPKKKKPWMMVAADGTDWNPGKGKGLYVWLNNTWNYVQVGDPIEPPPPPDPEPQEPPPPDPTNYDELFSFETDKTENGAFAIQAADPNRVQLVSLARHSTKAVQLTTNGADTGISGSGARERCDLRLSTQLSDGFVNREAWWAFSVRMPSNFQTPTKRWEGYVLLDFHATGGGLGGAPIQFDVSVDNTDRPAFRLIVQGGNTGDAANERRYKLRGGEEPIKNVWYDLVFYILWKRDNTGVTKLWMRKEGETLYKLEVNSAGPNMYIGYDNYLKLANYHEAKGVPSSVIHDRVVRGRFPYSVAMAELEGVPVP